MKHERVYLDYAATAPLDERVLAAMMPHLTESFGNANALYTEGRTAFRALEEARRSIASCIGARNPSELVFTSGGTEANNDALSGIARGVRHKGGVSGGPGHIIISGFEHHAVIEPAKALHADGFVTSYVAPRQDGFIHPGDLAALMRKDTVLVSIMTANNEIGTVQPIADLARVAHDGGALFHTDAVQALGKIPFDVQSLGVDAASFSAHKLCGPKGVGALYLKRTVPFYALIRGGGQEAGRRSGTQNVAGAVGFAKALELSLERLDEEYNRLAGLRDRCIRHMVSVSDRITTTVDYANSTSDRYLAHIVSFLVDGFESETMILRFDNEGIALSGGSACSTGSLEPSHVLRALGVSEQQSYGALRVSFGRWSTDDDIDRLGKALPVIFGF